MIIYINDQSHTLDSTCTLQEMLDQKNNFPEHMAVAINNHFIPKSKFCTTMLQDEDRIDLIVPMQGG